MESVVRILHSNNLFWITDIVEWQYIITAITVIKLHAGPKLDMEPHSALFWDLTLFSSVYK
jgi:hypothetical protein